ncbi:Homoserine O-acetyltransferase (EC [Olavius algarvensis Delta 1 endosymbiont]|nr:Homoserine O-acetyltransferase (EC [Olavius algarvensis Delta 1 endosymbiont]
MIVKSQVLKLSEPFITEKGDALNEAVVAYEEYGNVDGPVVFITHGGLSSHHAAGRYSPQDPLPGFWDDIIGPGKAIDTDNFRVLSANSLGSMYGSSSPLSVNPHTGRHYGPEFPEITLIDMVRFYKAFLDQMGVSKLFLMAGPSMGSLQALQMAALYPDFVGTAVAVATAGRMTPYGMGIHHFMINALQMDPEFNEGMYETGTPKLALRLIQQVARLYYIHESFVKERCWDSVAEGRDAQEKRSLKVKEYLQTGIEEQIEGRDPNCYIRVLNAINSYDLGRDVGDYQKGVRRIRCPVLLINISTDSEFPPYWAEELADILNKRNPDQAQVKILESAWGHMGCVQEGRAIGRYISEFLTTR